MKFAEKLKFVRLAQELSREDLAERARVTRSAIEKLEIGARQPSWETVQKLCRALDVDCDSLMDDDLPATDVQKEVLQRKAPRERRAQPKKTRKRK
jgi:transcriptional regulator with XRE-family HTH domain